MFAVKNNVPHMTTSEIIISCLNINIANAKNKGLREFAVNQLAEYQASLKKRNRPKPQAPLAFANFLNKLESEP